MNDTNTNEKMVPYFWKGLALFLLGIIVGFSFAPVKKGVMIASNNSAKNCGNNNKGKSKLPEFDNITSDDVDEEDMDNCDSMDDDNSEGYSF